MPMIPWFFTGNEHENLRANYDYINKENEIKYVDEFMEEVNQNKTSQIIFDNDFFNDFRDQYNKKKPIQNKEAFKKMANKYRTIESIETAVANEKDTNTKLKLFDVEVFLTFQKIDQLAKQQWFEKNTTNDIETQEDYQNAVLNAFNDIDLDNRKKEVREKVWYYRSSKHKIDWMDWTIYVLHWDSDAKFKTFVYIDTSWNISTLKFNSWFVKIWDKLIKMSEDIVWKSKDYLYNFKVLDNSDNNVSIDKLWNIDFVKDTTITDYNENGEKTKTREWYGEKQILTEYDKNWDKVTKITKNTRTWKVSVIKYKNWEVIEKIATDDKWNIIDKIIEDWKQINILKATEIKELTNEKEQLTQINAFKDAMKNKGSQIPDDFKVQYLFNQWDVYSITSNKKNTKERSKKNIEQHLWLNLSDFYNQEEIDLLKKDSNYINETHILTLTNRYLEEYVDIDYMPEVDRIMKINIDWEEQYILLRENRNREVTATVIDNQTINKVKIATKLGIAYNQKVIKYIEEETWKQLTDIEKTNIINAEWDETINIGDKEISFIYQKDETIDRSKYKNQETVMDNIQTNINNMDETIKKNVIIAETTENTKKQNEFEKEMWNKGMNIPENFKIQYIKENGNYSIRSNILKTTNKRAKENIKWKWLDLNDFYDQNKLNELKNNTNYITENEISTLTNRYLEEYEDYDPKNDRLVKMTLDQTEAYFILRSNWKSEILARKVDDKIIEKVKKATTLGLAYNKKLIEYIEEETKSTLTNEEKKEIINTKADNTIKIRWKEITFKYEKDDTNIDNNNKDVKTLIDEMDNYIKEHVEIK